MKGYFSKCGQIQEKLQISSVLVSRPSMENLTVYQELKGALSALRKFLAIESPLKMMKNVFYFSLKALFILKIFKFLF